jgi:hypothetical protein
MQEQDTSGNITPSPSANESEPQDMTENEMGEGPQVEFLNVMRRITFCQPPYHVSNPPQFQSYCNLPGPSAHTSYTGTLPSVDIPSGTHHKVCNDFQHQHNQSIENPHSEFTPSPQHSTSTNSSTPLAQSPSDGNSVSRLTDSELYELH